jgi:hypothetical protein
MVTTGGLIMTRGDKDLVHRIQLSQLQTDNPYRDDYYYYLHHLKQSKHADPKTADKKILLAITDEPKKTGDKITESKYII